MRIILPFISFIFLLCIGCKEEEMNTDASDLNEVNTTLDQWHKAATETRFTDYFNLMTTDAVFIGTDATEYWGVDSFKTFAKPFFDKGKAWSFTSVQRHVYFNTDHSIAWFDELLSTQMKICRGSGVLRKENNEWKIAQYVLSMTIPNSLTKDVVTLKTGVEDTMMQAISASK